MRSENSETLIVYRYVCVREPFIGPDKLRMQLVAGIALTVPGTWYRTVLHCIALSVLHASKVPGSTGRSYLLTRLNGTY